ncbi:MAG: hypothetical protein KDD48_01175 [Bdellovibrionales bacterium]|nr:hypothetical protein [Bdellovibrionales bacterium]
MIKQILLGGLFLAIGVAHSASIVVLQGDSSDFGRKFFSGFSSVVTESIKAFQYDISKDRAILEQIKSLQPDLILTIGKAPVEAMVNLLPSTPFIVSDYFSPSLVKKPNVVLMERIPPTDEAFELLFKFNPEIKSIGTIYNPQYSKSIFDRLVKSATSKKIRVASIKASQSKDVKSYVTAFAGKIDAYVAIRDLTLSSPTAMQAIYEFSQKNQVPVVSLDPAHQGQPALINLAVDPIQLGTQAWEVAKIVLREKKIPELPSKLAPSELNLTVSLSAVSLLEKGMQLLPKFLQETTDVNYTVRVIH